MQPPFSPTSSSPSSSVHVLYKIEPRVAQRLGNVSIGRIKIYCVKWFSALCEIVCLPSWDLVVVPRPLPSAVDYVIDEDEAPISTVSGGSPFAKKIILISLYV